MMRTPSKRLRARSGSIRAGLMLAIFIVGVVLWRGSHRRSADDVASDDAAQPADESKYTPTVDEGLGAAVAIVIDNSGSMEKPARGDTRPKYLVAREAVSQMLAATDSFAAAHPDFPIKVGLYHFATNVNNAVVIQPYDRSALTNALNAMPEPHGGTAIGEALDAARQGLYGSGVIRKSILVITDGENTEGRSPKSVAREIARRSEGAIRMYFVAFDVNADKFAFVRDVHGEVLSAGNGLALRTSLNTIYRGRILAEAMDAGERLSPRMDSARATPTSDPTRTKQP